MIYLRDLLGQDRNFREDQIFDSILQPPLYEQSTWQYEQYYLIGRRRRVFESWVLLQPKRYGIEI